MNGQHPPLSFSRLMLNSILTLTHALISRMLNVMTIILLKMMDLQKIGGGRRVFCNPPYGRVISKWVKKCYEESKKANTLVVMLIPARTDTSYFHDYIYHKAKEIRFIR